MKTARTIALVVPIALLAACSPKPPPREEVPPPLEKESPEVRRNEDVGGNTWTGGMPTEREVGSEAFALDVSLSSPLSEIHARDDVTVTARVSSRTAPHARTKLAFLVDDVVLKELEGVIPPYQAETAEFQWRAVPGTYTLKVLLSSAVGVELNRWEEVVTVNVPSEWMGRMRHDPGGFKEM